MVNMANCANVAMRLGTVKLFLGHLAFALFLYFKGPASHNVFAARLISTQNDGGLPTLPSANTLLSLRQWWWG